MTSRHANASDRKGAARDSDDGGDKLACRHPTQEVEKDVILKKITSFWVNQGVYV
jgi:hypothetical protein